MTNAITNTIVVINNAKLPVREYNGKRVVTFSDIDNVHERPAGTARKRFNDNKNRFILNEDYYKVKCDEVRPFFGHTPPNGFNPMLSENWYEGEMLDFIEAMSEKPNRDNNFELTCYYYRQWYNRTIYKKGLNRGNSWTQFNQYARAIDALASVAKAYRTGKVVKTFPWKDRAKGIVDTGFALANQHYQTIGMTKTNMIERK